MYDCDCGSKIKNIKPHLKTKKHIKWQEMNNKINREKETNLDFVHRPINSKIKINKEELKIINVKKEFIKIIKYINKNQKTIKINKQIKDNLKILINSWNNKQIFNKKHTLNKLHKMKYYHCYINLSENMKLKLMWNLYIKNYFKLIDLMEKKEFNESIQFNIIPPKNQKEKMIINFKC